MSGLGNFGQSAYRWMAGCVMALVLLVSTNLTLADTRPSPVGLWTTIDDETEQPRSVVRFEIVDDKLQGTIVEILPLPGDTGDGRCTECEGERKDQPIAGMMIVWGLTEDGVSWTGGEILDPNNGNVYSCNVTVAEDGASLEVRGFLGVSLFGRTQTWLKR